MSYTPRFQNLIPPTKNRKMQNHSASLLALFLSLCAGHRLVAQVIYDDSLARQHFWTIATMQPQTAASARMLSLRQASLAVQKSKMRARANGMQLSRQFKTYVLKSDQNLLELLAKAERPNQDVVKNFYEGVEQQDSNKEGTAVRFVGIQTGMVTDVIDGDTVIIDGQHKLRLWGIDAPESDQRFGKESKEYVYRSLKDRKVSYALMNTDRYGRFVAIVFKGRTNVITHLVENGYAWWYETYAPKAHPLKAAQFVAARLKKGLWADPSPMPPWTFRKQQ